jgi:hypothetical protein
MNEQQEAQQKRDAWVWREAQRSANENAIAIGIIIFTLLNCLYYFTR